MNTYTIILLSLFLANSTVIIQGINQHLKDKSKTLIDGKVLPMLSLTIQYWLIYSIVIYLLFQLKS